LQKKKIDISKKTKGKKGKSEKEERKRNKRKEEKKRRRRSREHVYITHYSRCFNYFSQSPSYINVKAAH
jgi:hypothetical protein